MQMPQVVKEVSKTVQDIKKQVNEKISFNIDDLNTDALKEKMSELISIRDNLFCLFNCFFNFSNNWY